jgi:uncharacterized membrane protein YphA (DoxX/SURF4 family)
MSDNFYINMNRYAPIILRYSMAIVVLWFSTQQFLHTDNFTAYIPESVPSLTHLSLTTLVYLNAVFELIFGILLLIGWKVRISALLLALHLFDIMYIVGYGEIGVRDFGLGMATLSVFMSGPDELSLDFKEEIYK